MAGGGVVGVIGSTGLGVGVGVIGAGVGVGFGVGLGGDDGGIYGGGGEG